MNRPLTNFILPSRRGFLLTGGLALANSVAAQEALPQTENHEDALRRFGFGWIRDLPDLGDGRFESRQSPSTLPTSVDLAPQFPTPQDQGAMGSCSAHAVASAVRFARSKAGFPSGRMPLSRLFIYYNARKIERSIALDGGATIRSCMRSIVDSGVCSEQSWPYDGVAGDPTTKLFPQGARAIQEPPKEIKDEAFSYRAIAYNSLSQDEITLKGCLASGFPFVFGFRVYSNMFDSSNNPQSIINMPGLHDRALSYGHSVLVVGYDDTTKMFKIRNSWGSHVQQNGYFYMHYDYVLNRNLSADFWVIQLTAAIIMMQD